MTAVGRVFVGGLLTGLLVACLQSDSEQAAQTASPTIAPTVLTEDPHDPHATPRDGPAISPTVVVEDTGSQHPTPTGGSTAVKKDPDLPEDLYVGPLPEGFRIYRDEDPFPEDAFVKFQNIARGPDPTYNHRWILYPDGRFFVAWHSGRADYDTIPFDTELPTEPTAILRPRMVRKVEKKLRAAHFLEQPPYQARLRYEDGAHYIVTVRLDGIVHEVIYIAYAPPLVTFLNDIGWQYYDGESDSTGSVESWLEELLGGAADEASTSNPS